MLDLRRQQGATLQRIVYRLVQSLPGRKREEGTDLVYCLANGDISPEQMVMKVEFEYLPNERRAFGSVYNKYTPGDSNAQPSVP